MKYRNFGMRRRVGLLILSVLLFFSTAWVVIDDLFAPLDNSGETVKIPDFVGVEASEITSYEEWLELDIEYRYDGSVPKGIVILQDPVGGSLRKISDASPICRVTLAVSLGEEVVTLPDLVGTDVREAQARLREMGLAVETEIRAGAYPEGEVYGMSPRSGEVLPIGARVTLYASAGTPNVTVAVPDLRGLSRGDALVKLWLSQLSVAEVIEVESDEPAGVVVRQDYPAGTVVMAGTKLTVYISRESGFE